VKTTALLKLPAFAGLKRTRTFVKLRPGMLKFVPETIANGPPTTDAVPPLIGALPRLVRRKLAWTLEPAEIRPKSNVPGETAS